MLVNDNIIAVVLLLATIFLQEQVVHFIHHLELPTVYLLTCHTPIENYICNFCKNKETLTTIISLIFQKYLLFVLLAKTTLIDKLATIIIHLSLPAVNLSYRSS